MNPFSLLIGFGATLGLFRVIQDLNSSNRLRWLLVSLATLFGALIGARAGFVVAYSSYFSRHLNEIVQITKGGLSWPGALAGLLLFAWLLFATCKIPILTGLDRLSRLLLPLGTAIWLAGWQAGIAYGKLLPSGTWWGMLTTDDSGMRALRVPLQPAATISLLIIIGLCEILLRQSKRPGIKSSVIGCVFSLHTLLFSFMRDDMVQHFLGLRLDTWAALFFCLVSLIFLSVILLDKPKSSEITTVKMES